MQKLENVGDFVIYKQDTPLINVVKIRDFFLEPNFTNVSKEFRWSTDNKVYSAWTEMTMDSLRAIEVKYTDELWFEVKFTLLSSPNVEIISFTLDLEYATSNYNHIDSPIFNCNEFGNLVGMMNLQNICFNPYDVNPAMCLYNELSYAVNTLFGHEVEYFKCDPDVNSKDVIFNEYSIYSVTRQECVKVLVEDNKFPEDTLQYNPFGLDFEVPFEVHIDKTYWSEIFGREAKPQKRDVLYFKLNNRVYEVMSSHLFSAFMEQPSYWKVSLVKYQPKANRYETQQIRETIDVLTTDSSELFEVEQRELEEKISKPQQYDHFKGNTKYDPTRNKVDGDLIILEKNIQNYSTIISEYQYKLSGLVNTNNQIQIPAIEYRAIGNLTPTDEFAYSSWFAIDKPNSIIYEDNLLVTNSPSPNYFTLMIDKIRNYKVGDYLKITRGSFVAYGMITTVLSNKEFTINVNPDVNIYFGNGFPSTTGYKVSQIIPTNFISAYNDNDNKGIEINLFADKYFLIKLNNNEYVIPLNNTLKINEYYGLFINISNRFKQLSLHLWKRKWIDSVPSSPRTTDLFNEFAMTLNGIDNSERISNVKYNIKASNLILTNIRVYDQTLEFEKHTNLLNQNVVQDEQRTIIIDNAIPGTQQTFISQSK